MIRPMVVLVVALALSFVLPTGTAFAPDPVDKERHRLFFLHGLPADMPRDTVGLLHPNGHARPSEVTVEEAAERYADQMVKFAKHADKAKGPWHPKYGVPEYEEPFNKASHNVPVAFAGFFALREFAWVSGSSNPTGACNGGSGGHSWMAAPQEVDEELLYPFVGLAHSKVAEHGAGEIRDVDARLVQDYHVPVYYGGNSNFFCFSATYGQGTLIYNLPSVNGFVIGA